MSYIVNSIKGNTKYKTANDLYKDVLDNMLQPKYGRVKSQKLLVNGSGSFNDVAVYLVTLGNNIQKKVAIRIAKKPSYQKVISSKGQSFMQIQQQYSAKLTPGKTHKLQKIKDDEKNSKYNWDLAASANLSPELYLYSYIEREVDGKIYLYICSISEGFEFDLDTFFTKVYPGLSREDKKFYNNTIRIQLTNLFENMAITHGMLCNDIKPKNAVINSDIRAVDVRLIDFDSDYCKIKERDRHKRELYALMMQIVFANFILSDYGVNIFVNYFISIKPRMEASKRDMMRIFLDSRGNDFAFTGEWYFKHYFKTSTIDPVALFNKMYKKCFEGRIDSPLRTVKGHVFIDITSSQQATSISGSPSQEQGVGIFGIAKSVLNFTKSFFIQNPNQSSTSDSQRLQDAEAGIVRIVKKKKKKIGEPCTDNKHCYTAKCVDNICISNVKRKGGKKNKTRKL